MAAADTEKKIGIGNAVASTTEIRKQEKGKREDRKKEGGGCGFVAAVVINIFIPKGAVSRYIFAVQCCIMQGEAVWLCWWFGWQKFCVRGVAILFFLESQQKAEK